MRVLSTIVQALSIVAVSGALGGNAAAQQLVESFVARLSAQDHFNSQGQRLSSAAAIIRQDRANLHQFGRADPEDESDRFFASRANRALLERMIEDGEAASAAIEAIVNGTPRIRVDILRGPRGHFVRIRVL